MSSINFNELADKYNALVIRERVLVLMLMAAVVFLFWYFIWWFSIENAMSVANKKREDLLSLSESIMSKYDVSVSKDSTNRNIAIIDKRISAIRSKMNLIDSDIQQFNEDTIAIGDIVLLLRDVLSANKQLTLESLKVYPAEVIKQKDKEDSSFTDAFEKNVISLKLKGNYGSVLSYLKKIEALNWSVYWQDVKYMVESYPVATVDINLYTLSVVEQERRYAAK